METKGIDLTKCNNLHAKVIAKTIDGKEFTSIGRIVIDEDGEGLLFADDGGYVDLFSDGRIDKDVIDFEILPRDPETYKDWQVGDKVCEDEHRNACYEVIFRSGELVVFKDWNNWASNPLTCSEAFTRFGMRLVMTDIEQQIIEEKRKQKYEPQDGDIVAWKDKEDDRKPAISIYKEKERGYATIYSHGGTEYSTYATFAMNIIRPATDEEKQRLFDAMAKEGKRWNAEKKVVEDIPKPHEFRKGEPVLVRDNGHVWKIGVFTKMRADYFRYGAMTNGLDEYGYLFCIPYNERTMHLLGTTEDYKEEELWRGECLRILQG